MEIQTAFADVKDELRLLDVPVPATYGPTADDDGGFGG